MSTEVATRAPAKGSLTIGDKVKGLRSMLEKSKGQIALALPKHMTPERMLRVVLTALQRTPKLLDCEPLSVVGAVVQLSQLGLEPDGILGQAYLIPFNNRKTGRVECQAMPGYKGLVDLSRRSGQLSTIYARVVHEKDFYLYEEGLEPKLVHRPCASEDAGELVAVYAVCRLRDGGVQFEWMWRWEIEKIRKSSRAASDGPWVTHFEEMSKKSVLRRVCKLLPVSVEHAEGIQKAVALDEHVEAGIPQHLAALVDLPGPEAGTKEADLDQLTRELEDGKDEEEQEPQQQQPTTRKRATSRRTRNTAKEAPPETEAPPPEVDDQEVDDQGGLEDGLDDEGDSLEVPPEEFDGRNPAKTDEEMIVELRHRLIECQATEQVSGLLMWWTGPPDIGAGITDQEIMEGGKQLCERQHQFLLKRKGK